MRVIAHIEDVLGDHRLLLHLLNGEYEVIRFTCLFDFLEQHRSFDLVVADLSLPESYGLETIKKVRKRYPKTPILALTGVAGAFMTGDIVKSFIDAGANNVASKNIITDPYLLQLIEELISSDSSKKLDT